MAEQDRIGCGRSRKALRAKNWHHASVRSPRAPEEALSDPIRSTTDDANQSRTCLPIDRYLIEGFGHIRDVLD
jgi:hypothetical protein